jgi:peptide/nickel transport system permease protein
MLIKMNYKALLILNRYKGGIVGVFLLLFLVTITIYTLLNIPSSERAEWNNPSYWINYPKNAAPFWTNYFMGIFDQKLPEHTIFTMNDAALKNYSEGTDYKIENRTFVYDYDFQTFPPAFSIPYSIQVGEIPPAVEISIKRPDGAAFVIYYNSLESTYTGIESQNRANETEEIQFNDEPLFENQNRTSKDDPTTNIASQRLFSSSREISESLSEYTNLFDFPIRGLPAEKIIFSDTKNNVPLQGKYEFIFSTYSFDDDTKVKDIQWIIEGKVHGLMGTDEFRRDISFGIMIGTPVAMFIGITVAITSTMIGLFYGLISGYKGGRTGGFMVIIIDIFLSVPTMVLFIILSLNYGKSLLFLIGLFILFGWPGLALINRTFSIQIKNYPYVEASKLMGESDFRIVLRHIVPQLIPFTMANFALSVPAAILGEAALSFLGFGDPSFPTWGQMLQDAHFSSAEILGYWWWIIPPGLMIAITSMAFILIGRSLESKAKLDKKR